MDVERARAFLLSLPHVAETMQWGDNLVFWVGDKAIGGKMFTLLNLDGVGDHGVASYSAGPERYAELIESEDIYPAPYMARIHWVAARNWQAFRDAAWKDELRAAHTITFNKLSPKVLKALALPERERKRLIESQRKVLAEKAKKPTPKG